jgi:hypothetical protein
MRTVFGYLSLFTSLSTLLGCALPSLLVLFGLGATVASFLSVAPWLVTLSRHKVWVLSANGALILLNAIYQQSGGCRRSFTSSDSSRRMR